MVAQNTLRTYGVHQKIRLVEGIWLHRNIRQILFFSEKTYLTSYVRNMFWATILYKYHYHMKWRNSYLEVKKNQNTHKLDTYIRCSFYSAHVNNEICDLTSLTLILMMCFHPYIWWEGGLFHSTLFLLVKTIEKVIFAR